MRWIYHSDHNAKIVEDDEVDTLLSEGWRLTPRHTVVETPREQAKRLGISVGGRSSDETIMKKIKDAN